MHHRMEVVAALDDEYLFSCQVEECGRELSLDRRSLTTTVLSQGMIEARHSGTIDGSKARLAID